MKSGAAKTIASECGVSTMTVNRALRNSGKVKEETRRRIINAAERLGYIRSPRRGRPSASGGQSAQKVQIFVGVTGRSLAVFHSQLLLALEHSLAEYGCDCVIRTCDGDYRRFLKLLEQAKNSDAVADLIIGSFDGKQLKALFEAVPNAMLLDNPGSAEIDSCYVSFAFDNVEAARLAVRHLLDIGRRRILLVGGVPEHFFTREIEQGYREMLSVQSVEIDEKLILHADFTAESAYRLVAKALDDGLQFNAVFTNDEMASGVYRALHERELSIPQTVAVCGCDGLPVGTHLYPKLTTVVLDYEELGKMAVQSIFAEPRDSQTPCRVRLLPRLEVRESTVA